VFRFELDEEDMERLLELSGQHVEEDTTTHDPDSDDDDEMHGVAAKSVRLPGGLFIPKQGGRFDKFNP